MTGQYGVIKNGTWTGEVVDRPPAWKGTLLPPSTPEDDYRAIGLWPVVDQHNGPNSPWERPDPPSLQEDATNKRILRVYEYSKMPVGDRAEIMRAQARERFANVIAGGFSWNGATWAMKGEAQEETRDLVVSIASGEGLPNGQTTVRLYDADGNAHDLDASQIKALAKAGLDFRSAAKDRLENVLTKIGAAASHADLDAVDITTI